MDIGVDYTITCSGLFRCTTMGRSQAESPSSRALNVYSYTITCSGLFRCTTMGRSQAESPISRATQCNDLLGIASNAGNGRAARKRGQREQNNVSNQGAMLLCGARSTMIAPSTVSASGTREKRLTRVFKTNISYCVLHKLCVFMFNYWQEIRMGHWGGN